MAIPRESIDASLREFLAALASAEAGHGAVSAAAAAGALGTSLLRMVAALPKTRSDSATDRTALISADTTLTSVQEELLGTIETETVVKIYTARNMPQASATQRTEREAAIQLALRAAADVPLEVMRLCALVYNKREPWAALLSCRSTGGGTWSQSAACRVLRRTIEPGS